MRILLLSLVFFLLAGCFTTKQTSKTASGWIYYLNYSKKDAIITVYAKTTENEDYQERGKDWLRYTGEKEHKFNANRVTAIPQDNFYKVEYYVEGKLIGVREYTRKELLLDKQGELVINKRGKIKR